MEPLGSMLVTDPLHAGALASSRAAGGTELVEIAFANEVKWRLVLP